MLAIHRQDNDPDDDIGRSSRTFDVAPIFCGFDFCVCFSVSLFIIFFFCVLPTRRSASYDAIIDLSKTKNTKKKTLKKCALQKQKYCMGDPGSRPPRKAAIFNAHWGALRREIVTIVSAIVLPAKAHNPYKIHQQQQREQPGMRIEANRPVLSAGQDNEARVPIGTSRRSFSYYFYYFFFGAALTASKAIRIGPVSRSGSEFSGLAFYATEFFCGPHATPPSARTQKDPEGRHKKKKGKKTRKTGRLHFNTQKEQIPRPSARVQIHLWMQKDTFCSRLSFKEIFKKKFYRVVRKNKSLKKNCYTKKIVLSTIQKIIIICN